MKQEYETRIKMKEDLFKKLPFETSADLSACVRILYKKGFREIPEDFGEYAYNKLAEEEMAKNGH